MGSPNGAPKAPALMAVELCCVGQGFGVRGRVLGHRRLCLTPAQGLCPVWASSAPQKNRVVPQFGSRGSAGWSQLRGHEAGERGKAAGARCRPCSAAGSSARRLLPPRAWSREAVPKSTSFLPKSSPSPQAAPAQPWLPPPPPSPYRGDAPARHPQKPPTPRRKFGNQELGEGGRRMLVQPWLSPQEGWDGSGGEAQNGTRRAPKRDGKPPGETEAPQRRCPVPWGRCVP